MENTNGKISLEAKWISPVELVVAPKGERPAYWLRGEFLLASKPASATLRVSAQGIYQGFINGSRVGDQELTPGSTQYRERIQVQSYDVTLQLTQGANALAVLLADGWFRGAADIMRSDKQFGEHVSLIAELTILDSSGAKSVWGTASDAFKFAPSHITGADLFLGQVEDRRLFDEAVTKSAFDDSGWLAPAEVEVKASLVEPVAPPVRRVETLAPKSITKLTDGASVVDFGQNINGWCRLSSLGSAGNRVVLTHAEWLDAKTGNISTANLDVQFPFMPHPIKDHQIDEVISAGIEGDVFEPKFTTHGFQFVRVEGFEGELTSADIQAVVVHTDLKKIGTFESSDERLTWLHKAADWSFRSNACDVPTDCPHRERAGWSGDWQIFIETAARLYEVDAFSRKWLADACLDQAPDGRIANVTPMTPSAGFDGPMGRMNGSSGWGDVIVQAPITAWREYGKPEAMQECFDAMVRWVGYAEFSAANERHESKSGPELPHEKFLWDTGFHWGEWLEPGVQGDPMAHAMQNNQGEVATAYFYRSAKDLAEVAEVLGKSMQAASYRALAQKVREAWQIEYLDASGLVKTQTQAAHVRALAFGLVPQKSAQAVADNLAAMIRDNQNRLGTGFLSTPFILPVLADFGHSDLAYEVLFQDQEPSWMNMRSKGATTIWERWSGVDESGIAHDSLNHYSKGAVVSFLHRYVAGLKATTPGYKTFEVKPTLGGGLSFAKAMLDSPNGLITAGWRIENGELIVDVQAPEATAGEIVMPSGAKVSVLGGTTTSARCSV
jgi:alpha-L-rhamnosidase